MRYLLLLVLLAGCDDSASQPQVIKLSEGRYEVRHKESADLLEVGTVVCDGPFKSASIGDRHDTVTGANVQVTVIRCTDEVETSFPAGQ